MEVMAGCGQAADVAWKVGRIMLKYRPIAPRPLTGGAVSAGPVDTKSGSGRGKRRRAGGLISSTRRARKSTKRSPAAAVVGKSSLSPLVTLSLLPGTPEPEEFAPATPSATASDVPVPASYFSEPTWRRLHAGAITNNSSSNNSGGSSGGGSGSSSSVVAPIPVRPVGSWVTLECVTDTWREGEAGPLGQEGDACPMFVSDACDRVTWTNPAYRRMVVGPRGEEGEEEFDGEEMRVALATRGLVPADRGVACFTCRVSVRNACRRRGKVSMAAPCDVWRLADGSLAWRLDVKAALSLGFGS